MEGELDRVRREAGDAVALYDLQRGQPPERQVDVGHALLNPDGVAAIERFGDDRHDRPVLARLEVRERAGVDALHMVARLGLGEVGYPEQGGEVDLARLPVISLDVGGE